jgi:hypothetical protein
VKVPFDQAGSIRVTSKIDTGALQGIVEAMAASIIK